MTIPKNVRAALGIETGDRVTFIVNGANVRVVNFAVYAMMRFQEQMKGQAKKVGMLIEEDFAEGLRNRTAKKTTNEDYDRCQCHHLGGVVSEREYGESVFSKP